jgi:hypothetical protein
MRRRFIDWLIQRLEWLTEKNAWKPRGFNLSPDGSGRYWLVGLAVGDDVAAGGGVTLKVSIRIFQVSPSRTLTAPQIALELYRTTALALKSKTPFPGPPDLIASRSYHVRGTLIVLVEMVAEMPFLEHSREKLLDGLPTENRSLRSRLNRVLRVQRGQGSGIAVIECLVKLLNDLLVYP